MSSSLNTCLFSVKENQKHLTLSGFQLKAQEYSWNETNDYGPKSAKRARNEISVVKEDKVDFNIWFFNVATGEYTNSAPFPTDLVKKHIDSWTVEGDLVLDPMCGTGTTCIVAKSLNRNYIGIDISEEYCKIAENRLNLVEK